MNETDLTPGGASPEEDAPLTEWPLPSVEEVPAPVEEPPASESCPAAEDGPGGPPSAPSGAYVVCDEVPPSGPSKPKRKLGPIVAIVAAAVVVLAAVAFFAVPAILKATNPKAYVATCVADTLAGYATGDSAAVAAALKDQPTRQTFAFHLGDQIPESLAYSLSYLFGVAPEDLPGTGVEYLVESDTAARKVSLEIPLYLGGDSVGSVLLFADDALVSLGSGALTGGTYYSVNTETFGADLLASPLFGPSADIDPAFGFNLFELDEDAQGDGDLLSAETTAEITRLGLEFNEAVTVEKAGSAAVQSLDADVNAVRYVMTIPADALHDLVVLSAQAMLADEGFLAAVTLNGDPQEFVDALDEMFSCVKDAVTIDFYIDKGKVVRMEALMPVVENGNSHDYRLTVECDGGSAAVANYTVTEDGGVPFSMVVSYKIDGSSFDLNLVGMDDQGAAAEFHVAGTQSADKSAKTLALDYSDISFTADGDTLSFTAGYSLAPLGSFTHDFPTDTVPFLELDEEGFYTFLLQLLTGMSALTQGAGA